MAQNKPHVKSGQLTEQDLQYAQVLLDWSKSLDARVTFFEDFERQYWEYRKIEEGERV